MFVQRSIDNTTLDHRHFLVLSTNSQGLCITPIRRQRRNQSHSYKRPSETILLCGITPSVPSEKICRKQRFPWSHTIKLFAHAPTSCLRQCSGYMHSSTSDNSHHKSGSFWKASGSPTFLHRYPNISSGRFRSHSCTPSSHQDRRMLHHPIRLRPTQACRRPHFHSTMAPLRDSASRSRQYQSSRADNCGLRLPRPSLGGSSQSFVRVNGWHAYFSRRGNAH
jgi:hypothetical protein